MNDKHRGADPYADLAKRTSGNRPKTGLIVIGISVGAVVLIAVLALLFTGGGDEPVADGTGAAAAQDATQEQAAVEVIGEPLPEYPQVAGVVAPAEDDPAVGMTPPTLEGESFDGTPVDITPGGGTPKLVMFVAHWCPHCQKELPLVQEWIDAGLVPDGVELFAVSTAVAADRPNYPPSEWIAAEGWEPQVLLDNPDQSAAMAYGLGGYPFFVLIDGDGKVVQRGSGEIPEQEFVRLLEQVA